MLKLFSLIVTLMIITCCSSPAHIEEELETALGVGIENPKSIYHHDEAGGFNEGYTIDVIELSDQSIQEFLESAGKNQYPSNENGWKVFHWKEAPILDSLDQVKELILNYYVDDERKHYQNEIRELMESKDAIYYSFYFKEAANNIIATKFYLVDVASKKVYSVKSSM